MISHTISCGLFGVEFTDFERTDDWESLLVDSVEDVDYTVLDTTFTAFDNGGLTGVVVLAESHLAIHTWPEYDYLSVVLESCKGKESSRQVVENLRDAIEHSDYSLEWSDQYARPPAKESDRS